MGKYTVFADVGKAIVDMLRDQMAPEPISKSEYIGLCDPKERGSFVLGIHPYNIKEITEIRMDNPIVLPDGNLVDPPTNYELYYMISIVSKSEVAAKSLDEHRILGRLLQIMSDNKVVPKKYLSDSMKTQDEDIRIQMIPMDLEEKVKIWTMFNEPYKLSTFYMISPVVVDSNVVRTPAKRVVSFEASTNIRK